MIRHNLLLWLRNIRRHKMDFTINLVGLSTGLACALLIGLWIKSELTVDKIHWNERLFQVMNNMDFAQDITTFKITPLPLADALAKEMPEVEYAVGVNDFFSREATEGFFSIGDRNIRAQGYNVGKDFFNVFSYKLISGEKSEVLSDKKNVVISESLAKKIFGTTYNIIGKTLQWKHPFFQGTFQVSGIFQEVPLNSTLQFDFLFNIQMLPEVDKWAQFWRTNTVETFVLIKEGADVGKFNQKIRGLMKAKEPLNDKSTLFAQLFSDRYLYGNYENGRPAGGRIAYVKLFSVIAIFILLIACVNFMNFSTAKASVRMKEIGLKKTIGASFKTLVSQFLGESLLMSFVSLSVAIGMVVLLLPAFNELTGKQLDLRIEPGDVLAILVIVLATGLVSGSYPAFYLSRFKPLDSLKGKLKTSVGALFVRKGLVIFQFSLSVIFIIGLLVVNEQIKFTQEKNLGYDRENIISFHWKGELFNAWNGLREGKSNKTFELFMQRLKNTPGVVHSTNISGNILSEIYGQSGVSWSGQEADRNFMFQSPIVGYDFMETLGIDLKEGRTFSKEYHDDYSRIILNEAAVKMMELVDPVGKKIDMNGGSEIVGVIKNFHYGSLHNPIEPLIFRFDPTGRNVMVKMKPGSERTTIEQLGKLYSEFLPGSDFEYRFMDEEYQKLYESESKVAVLSQYFSVIAIIISCLGLFGLASFTSQRRQKEIGVRKVLGAKETDIIRMLLNEFTRPVLVAIAISLPVGYMFARYWLRGYAERIELSVWLFVIPALVTLFITWLTVGVQTMKAASRNPVKSLKDD